MFLGKIIKDIPNALTILRIFLIPLLVLCFYIDQKIARYTATGIFIFASITDYIDGALARLWKAQSDFGRMLDPIADKMLVASTLLMLVHCNLAPVIPIIAILCREIFVSGMREYLAGLKVRLPVTLFGKIKTLLQLISIIIIMIGHDISPYQDIRYIGEYILWVSAIFTLISGYKYFREGIRHIQ